MTSKQELERAFCSRIDGLPEDTARQLIAEWDGACVVPRYAVEQTGARITNDPLPPGHPYGDDPTGCPLTAAGGEIDRIFRALTLPRPAGGRGLNPAQARERIGHQYGVDALVAWNRRRADEMSEA